MSPVMFSIIFKMLCAIVWAVLSLSDKDNENMYKASAVTLVSAAENQFSNWHDFVNHPKHDERRML